jgi:N-acetylmuramoyl-L-alanine amidase
MKIMLDAGHGYNTAGKRTIDGSMREWEFNNAVALLARDLLKDYQGVEIHLAHDATGKADVALKKRTDYANASGCDVYVSIHANAIGNSWNDAQGIETFVYPTKPKEAVALAEKMQRNLCVYTGRRNRGVKVADFHVLRETKMTAVLLECGFMTNKEEAELLKTKTYRVKCAKAIADALIAQYSLKKKPSAKPAVTVEKEADGYYVQVGFFRNRENAETLIKKLESDGYSAFLKTE